MRSFALIVTVLCLMVGPARAGNEFINGFDDLPLMAGLSELPGELMTFDSPTGRIVENTVQGNSNRLAVLEFYGATLPQLGWKQTGPDLFKREDETLRLELISREGVITVRFTLRPAEK